MSKKKYIAGLAFAVLVLAAAGSAGARPIEVSFGFFYSSLAPYGEWQQLSPWGWVWCPYDVGVDWRPYTYGDWVYTDDGWVFASPESWGWATYHYGRWGFDNDCGWYWVPDTVWGPAWVAWRFGGGFIGWCPLPPGIGWSFAAGLEFRDRDFDRLEWSRWSFCDARRFTDHDVRRYVFAPSRNVALLRSTRNVTAYSHEGNRIIDNNVNLTEIQRYTGRPVARYRISDVQGERPQSARIRGNTVQVFRPAVSSQGREQQPQNVLPQRHLAGTEQQFQKRQQKETQTLNKRFQSQQNEMQNRHQQEMKNAQRAPQPSRAEARPQAQAQPRRTEAPTVRPQEKKAPAANEEMTQRHQEERQAMKEEQQRQSHVLQSRQQRQTTQRAAARPQQKQTAKPAEQPKPKKKDA